MSRASYRSPLAGPGIMLLSAAIFGYFGFMLAFPELDRETGSLIPLVITLKWTLRAAAIGFLLAAVITMANTSAGNLLYALVGIVSAAMFVGIAVWDLGSAWHSGVHPFLLFVFAAWNGYSSFAGLRAVLSGRGDHGSFGPPPQGGDHL